MPFGAACFKKLNNNKINFQTGHSSKEGCLFLLNLFSNFNADNHNLIPMKHLMFFYLLLFSCTLSAQNLYDYNVEERLKELNIELSTPAKPVANYVGAIRTGNLIFLSGKISKDKNGELIKGKLGKDLTTDQGYEAAKSCGNDILSNLKEEVGDLNKVVRIVKVTGFVNSDPNFTDQSKVINGFSDLMADVFGERGKHARAAVGMASLPLGAAVEVEMIVEIQR